MSFERPSQRRGGRVRGAEGYHKEDVMALLKCTRDVVPTTTEEWNQVLDNYRKTHAIPNSRSQRDTNSLKVKFKQLARNFRPGESVHPEIVEAGSIFDLIEAKMVASQCLQRRGGRARGAEGFSAADSQAILRTVRQLLPVSRTDWEQAAQEYCKSYAEPHNRLNRDGISLKSKFRNWLKSDVGAIPRDEVSEALAIRKEMNAKLTKAKKAVPSGALKTEKVAAGSKNADDKGERNVEMAEVVIVAASNRHNESATSSEGGDKSSVGEHRRGGRIIGSEGYSHSDKWALLTCVKEVLPSGPTSWEQVLQLYRSNHAIPNDRAQRNLTGIKSKFRQLVSWKHGTDPGQIVPEETLEARAIQREIESRLTLGKRQRSDSESNVSFSDTSKEKRDEHSLPLAHAETRYDDNFERQNVGTCSPGPSVSAHVPTAEAVANWAKESASIVDASKTNEDDLVRSEIASRELKLIRQREQREAEQAAWEKERTTHEKQRMDMEAWTVVCDRLRALYRERAMEKNPEIVSEFDDEIAVLKKKKQRLASLLV